MFTAAHPTTDSRPKGTPEGCEALAASGSPPRAPSKATACTAEAKRTQLPAPELSPPQAQLCLRLMPAPCSLLLSPSTPCSSHPREGRGRCGLTVSPRQNRGVRSKMHRREEQASCGEGPCDRRGERCTETGPPGAAEPVSWEVLHGKRGHARRRALQAKPGMRMRAAIKILSFPKEVICLPRGSTSDLLPVLDTVLHTHSGFDPG